MFSTKLFSNNLFSTKVFSIIFFPTPAGALEKLQKNAGDKTPEKIQETKLQKKYRRQNSRKNTGDKDLNYETLCKSLPSAGLPQVGKRQEAELLAAVESQWFDQFEMVWSIRRDTL